MDEVKSFADRTELARKMPYGAVVAEIGVRRGGFSHLILTYARPKKLHLIDPWAAQDERVYPEARDKMAHSAEHQEENYLSVINKFFREIQKGRVVVHRGYSGDVMSSFPEGYFDWVYIDGNHTYEACRADLEISRRKVRKGGLIAGHDYIQGNPGDGVKFGVIEAVDSFCATHEWEIVCFADEFYEGSNFRSYVLAQKGSKRHCFREAPMAVVRRIAKKILRH